LFFQHGAVIEANLVEGLYGREVYGIDPGFPDEIMPHILVKKHGPDKRAVFEAAVGGGQGIMRVEHEIVEIGVVVVDIVPHDIFHPGGAVFHIPSSRAGTVGELNGMEELVSGGNLHGKGSIVIAEAGIGGIDIDIAGIIVIPPGPLVRREFHEGDTVGPGIMVHVNVIKVRAASLITVEGGSVVAQGVALVEPGPVEILAGPVDIIGDAVGRIDIHRRFVNRLTAGGIIMDSEETGGGIEISLLGYSRQKYGESISELLVGSVPVFGDIHNQQGTVF